MAAQPLETRETLGRVREAIRAAIPHADEVISYNMPTYKLRGRTVLQFAAWKTHYALYAASEELVSAFSNELRAYEIAKGTIRFPLDEPVPEALIAKIARFRIGAVEAG